MNKKAFIWASISSAIIMFVVAGIAHEVIFKPFFVDNTDSKHEGTAIIFVAYIILSFLMTYIYSIISQKTGSLLYGFQFGAIMGIVWVFPHGLAMAAAHGESLSYEVVNGLWHMIEQGIGGIAIALVWRKMNDTKH